MVSIVIGYIYGNNHDEFYMELWFLYCRVLKRNMEFAMMNELVETAKKLDIKNNRKLLSNRKIAMVKGFFDLQGFNIIYEDKDGNIVWDF